MSLLNKEGITDIYDFAIFSRDRIAGSANQVDFSIETHPKHVLFKVITLKSCSIPFSFKNITETYGDTIIIRATPNTTTPIFFYTLTIQLPHYYFTIEQLIQEINFKIAEEIIAQSIPFVFSVSFSGVNNYLQVNTSSLISSVEFRLLDLPDPSKSYVFQMLGLSTTQNSMFTNFGISGLYFELFGNAFTDDLPFSYLFIHIEQFPTSTYTTQISSSHFAIPTSFYRPYIVNGTNVTQNHPVSFEINTNFPQDIYIFRTLERLQRLQIKLTDERQNSVLEHAGSNEWSFLIGVVGSKFRN